MSNSTFEDNRGWGIEYPYRDDEDYRVTSFAEHLARSSSMISNSYGWAPNRAAKIYYEAYEENEAYAVQDWENDQEAMQAIARDEAGLAPRDSFDYGR